MSDIIKLVLLFVVVCLMVAAIVFWPLAIVWAFNALFSTTIPYNFWSWLAVCILTSVVSAGAVRR